MRLIRDGLLMGNPYYALFKKEEFWRRCLFFGLIFSLSVAVRMISFQWIFLKLRESQVYREEIRREVNEARIKIFDEVRNMEISNSKFSEYLESAKKIADYVVPHVTTFERIRWFVGLGTVTCVFLVWSLLVGALCCRCRSSEDKVRPTLLCAVMTSCAISVVLWIILMAALALSSHIELLVCRPLYDPEYRMMGAILESQFFLGKPLNLPLKDLFDKCQQNKSAYPAFQLGGSTSLEQLTAHWKWSGLTTALQNLKVNLRGLRILTPNLQQRLQSLLYACGANLTEHRIMIQGPMLNKDLGALSDQIEKVARQLKDRRIAQHLEKIVISMRALLFQKVKPLIKLQDELVYQLTALELRMQPFSRQVNQSISHLKTIQYYINNQGEKIAQLKTKSYVERLGDYLDQWRGHILLEMGNGVARCRPLWDVLHGLRLLLCQHILGPLNGFWFAIFLSILVLMASTPIAHTLASVYRKETSGKEVELLPARSESFDDDTTDHDTWCTPDPPPPQNGW